MARPSQAALRALLLLGCLCLGAPAPGAAAGQGLAGNPEEEGSTGVRGASRGLLGASGELAQELAPELAQELAPEQAPEEEGKVFTASFEFTGYSEGAEVPAAAPVPAPGPGYFFYSSGPAEGPAADDFETDESGEPCMRNKAGECVPVVYVRRSPGAGTPSPRQKSIRGDVGSTGGGTRSPADDGSSSSPNFELEVDTTDGSKDLAGTGSAPNGRKPPPAPAKKKAQGTKGKGASPRPSPKKKGKTPGKGRVPKPKSKAKPRPRPKAKRPRRKQGVRPKRKHLPMRQVDAQRVTRRPRRGLRTQAKDCICPTIYQPVCGVSGQVFGNACEANCVGIGIQFTCPAGQDPCKCEGLLEPGIDPPCPCTKELAPVCGADGKAYNNKCLAACAKTTACGPATMGTGTCRCKTSPPPPLPAKKPAPTPAKDECICDMMLAPVCGKDGAWYSNDCVAGCAKSGGVKCRSAALTAGKSCVCAKSPPPAKKATPPPPRPTCKCTKELRPVCGANGKAFGNKCLAACEAIKVICPATKAGGACTCKAPPQPLPVKKLSPPPPKTTAKSGASPPLRRPPPPHPADDPASCFCTADYSPVCSADGRFFSNACVAECAKASFMCPAAPPGPAGECRCLLDR